MTQLRIPGCAVLEMHAQDAIFQTDRSVLTEHLSRKDERATPRRVVDVIRRIQRDALIAENRAKSVVRNRSQFKTINAGQVVVANSGLEH